MTLLEDLAITTDEGSMDASINAIVEVTLIDYTNLLDSEPNDPFSRELKSLFEKGELEYYMPKASIGVNSFHVPIDFLKTIGIQIPEFAKEEGYIWESNFSEGHWRHVLPNKTAQEILAEREQAIPSIVKKIESKKSKPAQVSLQVSIDGTLLYDFAKLQSEFKISDSSSLAEFAYHKQLGPFSVTEKIERKQSLELTLTGIYHYNETSVVENYALSFVAAKTPNGKVTYRFKDNTNEDLGNGFFTLSAEQYTLLAAATNVELIYSLNKEVGIVLHELHFDDIIVSAYKEMIEENKDEKAKKEGAVALQQPYMEVLAERLYNSWVTKGLVVEEDSQKKIKVNNSLYSINDWIGMSQLAQFAGVTTSGIRMGYRNAHWEIEISMSRTRAKSFLYLANKNAFPNGGMYPTDSVLTILGINKDEISQAEEAFNISRVSQILESDGGLDLSKNTKAAIVRQAYNHLFETTIEMYFQ